MKDATSSNKLTPIKLVLWCIFGAFLLFIFIVLGSLLVQKYIKKSSVPMFAGYAALIVQTGSMSPTINQGDLIIIKKTNDYKLTDIVTYINESKETVTHRLIRHDENVEGAFVARGDFNDQEDMNPVTVDQIVGEWVFTIPKVGYVVEWFVHGGGIIYLVALIIIAVGGVYLWNAFKPESDTADASEDDMPKNDEQIEGAFQNASDIQDVDSFEDQFNPKN